MGRKWDSKIDRSHAAWKGLCKVRLRTCNKATVCGCTTNKTVPLGDVKVTNKITYVESIEREHVTKACNNPEKGGRRV